MFDQPATPAPAPTPDRDYDFSTERIASMDAAAVNHEITLLDGLNRSHPYFNENDRRHDAATQFFMALRERQTTLSPAQDDRGAAAMTATRQQEQTETRRKAEQIKSHLRSIGFDDFELPAEIEEADLSLWRRDGLIHQGRFKEVMPEIRSEAERLGLASDPSFRNFLQTLSTVITGDSADLERNSAMRTLAAATARGLQQLIADRIHQRRQRHNQIETEEYGKQGLTR